MRCLLVDDRVEEHKIFKGALDQTGLVIECQYEFNAKLALEKLLTAPVKDLPAVIFLDLYMPGMDGKVFLQEIKKDKRLKGIPVYIYTSSTSGADIQHLISSGAVYYIMKTSDVQALSKALRVLFGGLRNQN